MVFYVQKCSFTVKKMMPGICQLRLDFITLQLTAGIKALSDKLNNYQVIRPHHKNHPLP